MSDRRLRLFGVIHIDRPAKVRRELAAVAEGVDAIYIEQPRPELTLRTVARALATAPVVTVGLLSMILPWAPLQVALVRDAEAAEAVAVERLADERDLSVHAVDEHPIQILADAGIGWPLANYAALAGLLWTMPLATLATFGVVIASWLATTRVYKLDRRLWLGAHVPLTWGLVAGAVLAPQVPFSISPWFVAVVGMGVVALVTLERRNEHMLDTIDEIATERGDTDVVLVSGKAHLSGLAALADDVGWPVSLVHASKFARSSTHRFDPRESEGGNPVTVPGTERAVANRRVGAAAIDLFLQPFVVAPGVAVGLLVGGGLLAALAGGVAASFIYYELTERTFRQTPGKWLAGVAVASTHGPNVTFRQSALRTLCRPIDALGVGYVLARGDDRCRRLGDRVAGTVVRRRAGTEEGAETGDETREVAETDEAAETAADDQQSAATAAE